MSEAPIIASHVDHWYGEGALRRQVLFDVSAEIRQGEIVILSGPSGSGKSTLLTLIGALRSTQGGSLRVFDQQLRGAGERVLTDVRRHIGYVFQAHNLLDALTAQQNVEMGLQLHEYSPAERAERARELLAQVDLAELAGRHPNELSGGERQRVAIARALAAAPRILLADEPTASLDRETGREIVSLIERLARTHGITVVLVTHDARIFDVADRILSLEDGRLSSFMSAVSQDTRHLWGLLAREIRRGELVRRVRETPPVRFLALLEQVTEETRELVEMVDLVQSETFESMLAQVLEAFAGKAAEVVAADRARVRLADESSDFLAEAARADEDRHSLAIPFVDSKGHAFALLELERDAADEPFDDREVERLDTLVRSLSAVLEVWFRMSCSCRKERGLSAVGACEPAGFHAVRRPRETQDSS